MQSVGGEVYTHVHVNGCKTCASKCVCIYVHVCDQSGLAVTPLHIPFIDCEVRMFNNDRTFTEYDIHALKIVTIMCLEIE